MSLIQDTWSVLYVDGAGPRGNDGAKGDKGDKGDTGDVTPAALAAQAAAEAARDASALSATQAATSATNAATSATQASASATAADQYAQATAADRVQTGLDVLATSANLASATTQATNAANSATQAANSATAAATSASNALASQTAASNSATNAANSATSASNSATTATTQATNAATSATQAANSATAAAGSATTATTQAGIATTQATAASTSAANAATSATNAANSATAALNSQIAAAASVTALDLNGVTAAALHRSPNAVTAMFVYDTSKDSDGGAWTEKCQHTSWYNETINGKWLGAVSGANLAAAETTARAIAGAATNDYFQASFDGKFYRLNATSGTTEVFRGNKRDFPRLAGIVAESANVTIYDLTEPGRPMWMRFIATATATITAKNLLSGANSIAALGGQVFVGGSGTNLTGLTAIDFACDKARLRLTSGYTWTGIANRNSAGGYQSVDASVGGIVNATVNAVSAAVLPDAQIDPLTGLRIMTIAVATAGGISVIQKNGTVRNSSSTLAFNNIFVTPQLLTATRTADGTFYWAQNPDTLGASFALSTRTNTQSPGFGIGNTSGLIGSARTDFVRRSATAGLVQKLRNHESDPSKALTANITNTYNTGHQTGDIRRTYMADVGVGNATGSLADRSYKASSATINGTLVKSEVAAAAQLVAYSGFSAANYVRETYSADLDFGTGELTMSAWVSGVYGPKLNLLTKTEQFDDLSAWINTNATMSRQSNVEIAPNGTMTADKIIQTGAGTPGVVGFATTIANESYTTSVYAKAAGWNRIGIRAGVSATNHRATVNLIDGSVVSSEVGALSVQSAGNGWWRISITGIVTGTNYQISIEPHNTGVVQQNETPDGVSGIFIWGADLRFSGVGNDVYQAIDTASSPEYTLTIAERAHSSGAKIGLYWYQAGQIRAVVSDGTTTRTVTSAAEYYKTANWTKVRVNYTTDGTLSILVNGQSVAATRGNPLLTLNNSNAVLTIGNSFALDAPFPGSIALLKLSATVPTAEQAAWMYEQEKHLFQAGAQCCLPDAGAVVDLSYDDATDKWIAVSANNESEWSGLVRTSVTPVPAGSYTRVSAGSGVQLLARSTTSPGVDVTIPAYTVREEMLRRAEAAARLNTQTATFDYVGGFTANTTTGNTAILNALNLTYPVSFRGARVSGTGIPTNATIVDVSGTTQYLSAAATATGTAVAINFLDFILPTGMQAIAVMVNGVIQREGATAAYTRLFDGFRETIRFAAAPGNTAWVQIQATKVMV